MSGSTKIEWADRVWNPVVGCSVVSAGCTNCYAMRMAARWRDTPSSVYYGLSRLRMYKGAMWTGDVRRAPDVTMTAPLRWRKPARIFVNSMGDLFHEAVPDEWIDEVFAVMALAPQHRFMVLTKRPERMRRYLEDGFRPLRVAASIRRPRDFDFSNWRWPLPNVWFGVSAEDQPTADERIPPLLGIPAAGRFVSAEPLLGPVDLTAIGLPSGGFWGSIDRIEAVMMAGGTVPTTLDLVIAGGESGPGARPMHPDWARSLRDQCAAAGVPFHFKQWGEWSALGPSDDDDVDAVRIDNTRLSDGYVLDRRYRIMDRNGCCWENEIAQPPGHAWGFLRVGKAKAGRILDGRTHDALAPLPGDAP